MKEVKLSISINRPVHEVFDFSINPKNTPKWIDDIAKEEVSEKPSKLGTVYKYQNLEGQWIEYEMTTFEPDRMYVLSAKDYNDHIKYTFTPLGDNQCELEYHEWVDNDGSPFTKEIQQKIQELLQKLKKVLEAEAVVSHA